ncbi:Kinetochore protein, partial [Lachnellula willkommii]
MSSRDEATLPATRPKSRKSLAHIPSSKAVDQENMTADLGALSSGKKAVPIEKAAKKSRSKSIGPGGLDALKDTSGNRRKSLAAVPHAPPRSILKPTMPPLPEIPAHRSTRKGSPKKATPPSAQKSENLIDFDVGPSATISGTDNLPNPFQVGESAALSETRVTLRTEEEQQTAAREREEKERKELEKEVMSRRDARRKSLANRRVSFAPEATLHTWDVVVEYQDSTTSSNATSSTRRASSASGESPHPQTPGLTSSDPSEPPSTPPEQVEEDTVKASPAHQRDLHQKKRRRSSGIPPMNFNNPDEAFSSSPLSDADSVDDVDEVVEDDLISNSDESDVDADGTAMSMDGGETTDMSMASIKSASSTGSSSRLDEALRLAARQAGTQGIDFDENGDEMEEGDDVVASFAPWTKPAVNLEAQLDQENVNPFSPAFKAGAQQPDEESDGEDMTMDMTRPMGGIMPAPEPDEDEMSMDVTRAFGSIIQNEAPKPTNRRKSVAAGRRQSTRRKSAGEDSNGDETMDLTVAVGSIQPAQAKAGSSDDEDMTMEFTSVVGGVLPQANPPRTRNRAPLAAQPRGQKRSRESLDSNMGDDTMDMTVAIGGIMPSISESAPEEQDATMGMDMTTALGGILQPQRSTGSRSHAKKVMELETDLGSSPFQAEVIANSSPRAPAAAPVHTIASETGSPSLSGFRGKALRRSTEARRSTTPKSKLGNDGTPIKNPGTPSKQLTPQPARPTTPNKTPPSKNVTIRSASPKKLFKDEIQAASSTPQSAKGSGKGRKTATPSKLFKENKTGVATPNFILTPQPRRISGVGLDREGLGSPRIAALLDRRTSIGDQAKSFVPGQFDVARGVRFDDPQVIEEAIDKEREQDEDRESGRSILEREADQEEEKDATLNLKEMIQSLTPKKKNPLKGRKSLHVGAAKGILGKRPAELDDDDEDEDEGGVKRLKNHQGSPVKNVKLRGPPSKAETTGRMTRAARKSLEDATTTPSTFSPTKAKVTTPRAQGRFKDAEAYAPAQIGPLAEKEPVEDPQVSEESFDDDRIQLQDFLNMTSIRFMELTTTKRRHTIAPKPTTDSRDQKDETVVLEDCVAAGAATIPMLELFQHACHELKSYISEGRKTVREIETETFEENPPLFREYISATPDMKLVMDNQLKNVKTHARLLSKGMWYDWRMTLLGTLKEGLFKTGEGMIKDEEILDHQQALLDTVLPKLIQKAEALQTQEADLQAAAEELANCDPEELSNARQELISVDAEVEEKKRLIADLRKQLQGKEAEIESGVEKKQAWLEEIREAEKIREECRGWTSTEISALKGKVEAIEKEHGWTITGVSGTTTSMTYKKDIELVFDAASFLPSHTKSTATQPSNSRIDLWYIGNNRSLDPQPLTPTKDFFLQSIRDYIRGLPQSRTSVKTLLSAVSNSWNMALAVTSDIRLLRVSCPTEIEKTSDDTIVVKSTLLIPALTTKVEIQIGMRNGAGEQGVEVAVTYAARVVYGERFNEPK